jgi:glycosyltransferase involved in cell wall biosynthesis
MTRAVLVQPRAASLRSGGSRWNAEVAARGVCQLVRSDSVLVPTMTEVVVLDSLFLAAPATPGELAILRARSPRPRVVWLVHALPSDLGAQPAAIESAILAASDLVILPGPTLASRIPGRIAVCPAGVDPALRLLPAPPPGPPVILSCGAVSRVKRQHLLGKALATLLDRPWTWHLMGEVVDHEIRVAIDLPAARLRFSVGDPAAVGRALAEASLCAHASVSENAPLWAREALAAGRPIVSTRVGDVETLIDGRFVDALAAPEALAAALRATLDDLPAGTVRARAAGARLPTWEDTARALSAVLAAI